MPRPATLTDAIGLVRKSGLLDDGAVKEFVDRMRRRGLRGLTTDALLASMVEQGLLTRFQGHQLAEGRWRGLVLGDYDLKARIGRGGMGQVFLGEHRSLKRTVAIKVLNASLADDPLAKARLEREARATAALDSPHIVKVFGFDSEHSPPYIVMEYVDGVSLQALVALTGTLRVEAAVLCARQIADGLAHAAAAGSVHRDVKPANLLLDRTGVVKILDMGIVLMSGDSQALTLRAEGPSPILGTIDYIAPEQAVDSHAVDGRADIYALGGTLYFLLAGQPPFAGGEPMTRLRQKQAADPEPIHRLRPDVPEALSAAIAKMLARDPADRYQSAGDAAEALAPWAVPVPGFPEELFERIGPPDWSGEFPAQGKGSGAVPTARAERAGWNAYGSNVHSGLAQMPAESPTLPCGTGPALLSSSLTVTPPPHSHPTRPERCLPSNSPPPTERMPVLPPRGALPVPGARKFPVRTAAIVGLMLILALAVAVCLLAIATGTATGARPCDRPSGTGEVDAQSEYPLQLCRGFLLEQKGHRSG